MRSLSRPAGYVGQFFSGAGYLVRGLGMWVTSPRLMLIGAIPALIVFAVFATGLVFFAIYLGPISAWLTPFAIEWSDPLRVSAQIVAGVAATVVVVLGMLLAFTAVTLIVGDPFYERIWREVETRAGGAPSGEAPFWSSLARGIGNGIRLLLVAVVAGLVLFVLGFIPILGQSVVPVLGVAVGGWLLAVELTGFAFDSRRVGLAERRRMLREIRPTTLGFGVATYLLFLIPLGAVFVMPAAVAGATLLSRSVLMAPVRVTATETPPGR